MKLFVTGVDTGVGKTIVSAAIIAQSLLDNPTARVAYLKPVQTGVTPERDESDAECVFRVVRALCADVTRLAVETVYCFEIPAAPAVADRDGDVDLRVIEARIKQLDAAYDILIIEGAGGLCVPMTCHHLLIDWLAIWQIPTVLVTTPRLGFINHTLLSANALQQREIPIAGVLVNELPREATGEPAVDEYMLQARRWLDSKIALVGLHRFDMTAPALGTAWSEPRIIQHFLPLKQEQFAR
jgi:dethiobiotin synthetase